MTVTDVPSAALELKEACTVRLAPAVDLTTIPTLRFNTVFIKAFVHQHLRRKDVTRTAIIPFLLRRGCRRFPTLRKLALQLESLFGAVLETDVVKLGERQLIEISLDVLGDTYLPSRTGNLQRALQLLCNLLLFPAEEKGAFKNEYVQQEKLNLKNQIRSLLDDKSALAARRHLECMCKNEPFALYHLGCEQDVEHLEPRQLWRHHQWLLKKHPIDFFIMGPVSPQKVLRILKQCFTISRNRSPVKIPDTLVHVPVSETRFVTEKHQVDQGKLILGYRTYTTPADDDDFVPLAMANVILGDTMASRLFMKVREQVGLAYYISSHLDRNKGLLRVFAGIDFDKADAVTRMVAEQIEQLAAGKISAQELEAARKTLRGRLLTLGDSPDSLIGSYLAWKVQGLKFDPQLLLEKIEQVSATDIQRASGKLKLDTVYFMCGDN
jgi:predicted Zn-dependent peptidase